MSISVEISFYISSGEEENLTTTMLTMKDKGLSIREANDQWCFKANCYITYN